MADQSRPPVTGYPAASGYPPPPPPQTSNQNGHSNAGTAYPYAAPLHTQQNPAYYNPNPYYNTQPYDDHRALFLRRVFTIVVAAFIIAGSIAFIIWLILRPQLPDVRIDSLSVTNLNLSSSPSSSISGNWDVRFTFRNPNGKITLYYDRIEGYVYYQRVSLSETTVPPFFQGKRDESPARATFAASSAFIEKPVSDGMIEDKGRGAVTFNVRLSTRVQFKAGLWWTRRRFVRVYCGDLRVGFSSNSSSNEGNLTSGARECKVGL
ncbi:NDR1/HIN1-like protein 1 [Impatiens glandulifera]|uniref:NDR1/HIN1-like protein 1 n=1 Tax=Impatiens glandulifera TaxID=253017 RepID=UPI001FB0F71D|nr:NDR1/HIN1-like protein 1 [Impatiens glandulifera]